MPKSISHRWILIILIIVLGGCNSEKPHFPADTLAVQQQIAAAWAQPMHGVWELTWTAMPIDGTLVFEAWTTQNADRQRFEILEASSPALVGMAYVNNGKNATVFNRLETTVMPFVGDANTPFSPITDARAFIKAALTQTPQSTQETNDGYIFRYADGNILRVSFDSHQKYINKITLKSPADNLTLNARTLEILESPPEALFSDPKK